MKPRDRVLTALNHETPDRCPMQVSFTPEFASRLRRELKLGGDHLHNPHGGGNTYELERVLGEDLLLTSVGWANSYYQDEIEYVDEWGIGWRSVPYDTPYGPGRYTEFNQHPLAENRAIDTYQPPDPTRPELYEEAAWVLRNFKDEYWIVGVTVTTIFECAWALRGYERMLSDFALNPELAEQILDIPYRYHLAVAKKLTAMGVDMIWTGDDVGAQNAMLISPKMWRKFLKPRMANFIAELKAINPQVKVAYHSDGAIDSIIPDLIEIGLDVLNPIQPASMDPVRLKREYGDAALLLGLYRRTTHPAIRVAGGRSGGGSQPPGNTGQEWRLDPGAYPSCPAGYAHGELLGAGQYGHPNALSKFLSGIKIVHPKRDHPMHGSITQTAWHGLAAWALENEFLRTIVVPELGAKLVSLIDKRSQKEWLADPGDRPVKKVAYGAVFTDQDLSGWDEMFPTIVACEYPAPGREHGVFLPDHGEVWALPWTLEPAPAEVLKLSVEGVALSYRLVRTLTLRAPDTLEMHYELQNLGDERMPYIWAAHPQFVCGESAEIRFPSHVHTVCNTLDASWGWGEPETRFAWPEAIRVDDQTARIDHTGAASLNRPVNSLLPRIPGSPGPACCANRKETGCAWTGM